LSSLPKQKNKKSFLRQKLLPMLIITTVIIVVLISIGDLGKLIEETTGKTSLKDLGLIRNCNPIKALCSITTSIEKQRVRVSMNVDEGSTYQDKNIPVNVRISGLNASNIKSVYVSLELSGHQVRENKQYLRMESTSDSEKNSHWINKIKKIQLIKDRNDWLAIVHITLTRPIQKIQEIVVSFQFYSLLK
jgi:Flp pilus assembly secretin CpaC